jgi:hypothetical protein
LHVISNRLVIGDFLKLCKDFDIQGFPTVIIEAGGRRGVYKGPREAKDLIETVKDL